MKTLLFILFSAAVTFSLYAQQEPVTTCKVLLLSIGDHYEGECKKGLADGTGVATGKDSYIGEFRKGLPDGRGIYTWSTGEVYDGSWIQGQRDGYGVFSYRVNDVDSLITGYWKSDKYLGTEYRKYDYKVLEKRDIDDARFLRMDKVGNQVRISIFKSGLENRSVSDVMIWGDSGSQSASFLGYDSVNFPFTCQLTYQSTNKLGSSNLICKLVFVIYEQGCWEVQVHN